MRIYRMTATFGKLEHETLTLEPGLNVITAPNEWGKSTWCAFLENMLYGLDTRAKSTKTALADKEWYAPWSGSPMSGRIELNWKGRDITLERTTRGRTPMGEFRAFETDSGVEIPELNGKNCGLVLLGVERSVFQQTAFLRQSDMPVIQDEALRRRLNDLVTTGDESGDADRLAEELRELKNRCRYNRTGLIPQTEAKYQQIGEKIAEREALEAHSRTLKIRLDTVKSELKALENHQTALKYAAAEADAARVAEAKEVLDRAEVHLLAQEAGCAGLPGREETLKKEKQLRAFCEDWRQLQMEQALQGKEPQKPDIPEQFREQTRQQAEDRIRRDLARAEQLKKTNTWIFPVVLAVATGLLAVAAMWFDVGLAAVLCLLAGAFALLSGLRKQKKQRRELAALLEAYDGEKPELWLLPVEKYDRAMEHYRKELDAYLQSRGDLEIRETFLLKQKETLCGFRTPETVLEFWQQARRRWENYETAIKEVRQAQSHYNTLRDMVRPVAAPAAVDTLHWSAAETQQRIQAAREEQQRLLGQLGQYRGRMEALGDPDRMETERTELRTRLEKLEETYGALTLALETLEESRKELQRRFAPGIARRAGELMHTMTAGRYDRVALEADLSLLSGAEGEDTLREALWRSDGTADQLYVALRLAVAEALLPEGPLILDDAFVRFDDERLKAAMEILKDQAEGKQVVVFSCQKREKEYV